MWLGFPGSLAQYIITCCDECCWPHSLMSLVKAQMYSYSHILLTVREHDKDDLGGFLLGS